MNKQLSYFLKNYRLFYDIEDIEIEHCLGSNIRLSVCKHCDDSFWKEKKDINYKEVVWKVWKNVKIPFLFEKDDTKEIISYKEEKAIINYDIISSAFYFLSGWNEYVDSSKDEFGRVEYKNCIVNKLNVAHIPIVNYYFDILHEAIKKIYGNDKKRQLWKGENFAINLTHDIDTCKSAWIEGSFSELKKKRIFSIPKLIMKRFFQEDDWFNFNAIMDIERKYDAASTFYFLSQKGRVGNWKNADYSISSNGIQKAIANITANNFKVGVHGSFGTHDNSKQLKIDIERINAQPIVGNRFHFLMFDPEKTVNVLEECNIKYDTTLGFAEQIGFRRGTCYPFYLWNFKKDNASSVIEIPLIVMDGTLANKKYMGVSKDEALLKVYSLIDEVKRFEGVFTILWHNTYFSDYKYTGWKNIYCKILEYAKAKNGLFLTGENIVNAIEK